MSLLKHMIERFENPFERFGPRQERPARSRTRPAALALSLLAETR